MPEFTCRDCGATFSLSQAILDRYPGWVPRQCRPCRDGRSSGQTTSGAERPRRTATRRGSVAGALYSTDEVLEKFTAGPRSGVFTDGGSVPNPGPGGWGAVYVIGGEIIAEASGHDPATTNNRMELTAVIEAAKLVPVGTPATVYADSKLTINTVTEWAAGWEKRGWKRKRGPVENLDLVKTAFYTFRRRPELRMEWIAAHSGYRWNEYADALANRWRLD
jgi:ribonuclease HI